MWLLIPLINRAMFPRLSGQITRLIDGSSAKRRVIMLSPSSFSLCWRKSTSPVYSAMNVMSLIRASASTVNLHRIKHGKWKGLNDVIVSMISSCSIHVRKEYPSHESKITERGGHMPLLHSDLHCSKVSMSSLART